MGNLLDNETGLTHCDVNRDHFFAGKPASPFRRMLCDLRAAVPDAWRDVGNSKVTCPDCQLRIDTVHAIARGEFDPRGLLSLEAVTIATAIFADVQEYGAHHEMEVGEFASWVANMLYHGDDERYNWFLKRALDGETS
jgi:hypothetical protein